MVCNVHLYLLSIYIYILLTVIILFIHMVLHNCIFYFWNMVYHVHDWFFFSSFLGGKYIHYKNCMLINVLYFFISDMEIIIFISTVSYDLVYVCLYEKKIVFCQLIFLFYHTVLSWINLAGVNFHNLAKRKNKRDYFVFSIFIIMTKFSFHYR